MCHTGIPQSPAFSKRGEAVIDYVLHTTSIEKETQGKIFAQQAKDGGNAGSWEIRFLYFVFCLSYWFSFVVGENGSTLLINRSNNNISPKAPAATFPLGG